MTLWRRDANPEALLDRISRPWRTREQLSRLASLSRPPSEPFEFAVLGDAEPGRFWIFRALYNRKGVFSRQLARVQEQAVDFSVQLGDMVSRGIPRRYLEFFRELESVGVQKPYLTVIGNHDRSRPHGGSHARAYRRLFGRTNYSFDYGGARFVALDSSARRLSRLQLRWLGLVLATPLRKVIFTHMPPVHLRLWGGAAAHRMGGFTRGAREFTDLIVAQRSFQADARVACDNEIYYGAFNRGERA